MVIQSRVQLLIDALESDEFPQADGKLCAIAKDGTRKWCCLGVGTIVAIRNGLDITERLEKGAVTDQIRFHDEPGRGGDSSATMLTSKVMGWYGFETCDPMLTGETVIDAVRQSEVKRNFHCPCNNCQEVYEFTPCQEGYSATVCNDTYKMTFVQIAQAFRETYITLNLDEVNDEAA